MNVIWAPFYSGPNVGLPSIDIVLEVRTLLQIRAPIQYKDDILLV